MNEISMPVVALRGLTILPEMVVHFDVSRVLNQCCQCGYGRGGTENLSDGAERP